MKLTFLGANHEVTGSCTLLEWQDGRYCLIDRGMEQGTDVFVNPALPVPASAISLVLVTHAHIDHTGLLPLLYRDGFRGEVWATRETCSLMNVMLADSAHIQMTEAEYRNRKAERAGGESAEPLYDLDDVAGLMKLVRPCNYDTDYEPAPGLTIRFTDIGHLLGSAAIECTVTDRGVTKKIVFSGDIGNAGQPMINDPKPVHGADYLLIESTYGDRLHDKRVDPSPALADAIQTTLDRGGNLIIPAFAVGRTQEALYFIRAIKAKGLVHGHDGFPVYVDSPLANEATAIFQHCSLSCLDDEARAIVESGRNPLMFDGLRISSTSEDSKRLNDDREPKVIISSSGMCDAGRVRHHLKYNLWKPESMVLFTGYQSNGTLGRLLLDGAESVKLFGDEIAVKAEIRSLNGVSGHADRDGLLRWVAGFEKMPERIFVNHGEDETGEAFAQLLRDTFGTAVDVPYGGAAFDLAAGGWILLTEGVRAAKKPKTKAAKQETKTSKKAARKAWNGLLQAVAALSRAAEGSRSMAADELKKITSEINRITRRLGR